MARTLKYASLETPTARRGLKHKNKPYWLTIELAVLKLGYYKPKKGTCKCQYANENGQHAKASPKPRGS
jgi:hypothetical protein